MTGNVCFHCHLPLPDAEHFYAQVLGQRQAFCCPGCQAVAEAIVQNGLEDYYRFRTEAAPQAKSAALIPDELTLFDDAELQQDFVQQDDETCETTLTIEGISCAACGWLIERQLAKIAGIRQVAVNVAQRRALIRWQSDQTKLSTILSRLRHIGYNGFPFQPDKHEASYQNEQQGFMKKLGLAGIMTMQVMMLMAAHYFDWLGEMSSFMQQYFNWIALLLTTPVVIYSGAGFYASAYRALRAGSVNMDVPITIAVFLTYGSGFAATWQQTGQVYFESICMFIFLLLLSRFIEHKSRYQAMQISANMLKYIPMSALIVKDGATHPALARKLLPGDTIIVKAGELIPVDGVVCQGSSKVDEAMLTGEPTAVTKVPGDKVHGGTLNRSQVLTIEVQASLAHSLISQIIHLQEQAVANRPTAAKLADQLASYFVLAVLLIASLTYAYWYVMGNPQALWITIAVLVATCPCALGLATPTALTSAVAWLNRQGVLIKRTDVLETIEKVTTVAFDKTGTLTQGDFSIHAQWYANEADKATVLAIAGAIEAHSEHPLAAVFARYRQGSVLLSLPHDVTIHAGLGISACYNRQHYKIGSPAFMLAQDTEDTSCPVLPSLPFTANVMLACNGKLIAAWQISDSIKAGVDSVLARLTQQHKTKTTAILSGDSQYNVDLVARQLNIQHPIAALTPAAKLDYVMQLQARGEIVMMLGDGINDAPVLSQADVAVAVGSGTDIAKASADIIFLNDSLHALPGLFTVSARTRQIIRQNFAWALGYNVCILPLAVSGILHPWMAVVGMSLSSIIVVINSTRLIRFTA